MRNSTFLKSFLLLCALIVGVGTSWAADIWVKTAPADLASGDIVVIVDQTTSKAMSNNNGTSNPPAATKVTLNTAKDEITSEVASTLQWKVTVTVNGDTRSYQFGVSGTSNYLYCTNTNNGVRVGTNSNNAFTYEKDESNDSQNTIEYYLKNTGTSRFLGVYSSNDWRCYTNVNSNIKETLTAFYKKVSSSDPSVATSITIDDSGITNTNVFTGTAAGKLAATVTAGGTAISGATVTWESGTTSVATIASDGTVTLVAAGTTTITASYAGIANQYKPSTQTYELTVTNVDPNAPGTKDNPYTVAQARAAIDAGTGITGVYATGVVSQIVTAFNSQYGNISYNISADGLTTSAQLQAFRGKGIGGVDFTSENDIQVGDEVVIYGNLTKYNSTYEFAQDNQLVSLKRKPVPSITVDPTTVNVDAAEHEGTITVTYNNITDVIAEVQFFEADGTTAATYSWLTADINKSNHVGYIIEENTTDAARTAYMKVYALDDDANDVYSALITITQAARDYATLPFEYNGGKGNLPVGLTHSGLGKDYASAPYLKFDNTDDCLILKFNEAPGLLSFDIKGYEFSDGTFTVQTSVDGTTYTDLKTYTEFGSSTQNESFSDIASNARFIKWVYTNKKNGNVALGNIKLEKNKRVVTVTDAGWATWVAPVNVDVPSGVKAYAVKVNGKKTELTELSFIPENLPVLLKNAGTFEFPVAEVIPDVLIDTDLLVSDGTVSDAYVLAEIGGAVAFYRWGLSDPFPAGKVYLPVTSPAPDFISLDDDATGIEDAVKSEEIRDKSYYNLNGQRVAQPTKGLYIVNGKKVIVK